MNQSLNKKSKISVIMQARVGSTRLPAKVLKTICGKTVLEHDIERCLRIKNASGVIIATTVEPDAQKIVDICSLFPSEKVKYFRGSVEDVLERYYCAARQYHVDIIVRLTSDNPLLDPMLVDLMLERFIELGKTRGVDYLANNLIPTFPYGLDAEIFTFDALEKAYNRADKPEEREHVTPYIRNHPDLFKLENYAGDENLSHYRWSVDYPEDFEFVSAVYNYLYPTKPDFSMQDVLDLLRRHPELADINRHRNTRIC